MRKKSITRIPSIFQITLTISITLLLSSLVGCKSIEIKDKPDLLPYMLKPVAFLTIKSPKNLEPVWPNLMETMEQRLRKMPVLGRITGIKERQMKLADSPKLRSSYKTYLSTLTLTGISDKELAWQIVDKFDTPHFILLDFVSFPCTKDCPSDEQWIIRLKMIEARSGEIIYQGRLSHKLDEDEKSLETYKALAGKLISDVTEEFAAGFTVPWHRWRYDHLKRESELNLRSEMGI